MAITPLTPGKIRHLDRCTDALGVFSVLAIDHRRNLQDSMEHAHGAITRDQFVGFKQAIIEILSPEASAILTDPEFGLAPALEGGFMPSQAGLLLPLEVTDYSIDMARRHFAPIPDWGVDKIKRIGADGVKLLLYFHPDAPNAGYQVDVVAQTVEQCAAWDIPLFLEPIIYAPDGQFASSQQFTEVLVNAAAQFADMGVDVLKMQFPAEIALEPNENQWFEACMALDDVCRARGTPWALLSAGVSFDVFRQQTVMACEAGASGVIVGRAIWNEAVSLADDALGDFLKHTASERMAQLVEICALDARGWREVAAPRMSTFGDDWMQRY
jgi:tagatose 1,6-diphosphate aldolase